MSAELKVRAFPGGTSSAALPQLPLARRVVDRIAVIEQAGEDPGDVGIDRWSRPVEGKAGHSASHIGANSRQLPKGSRVRRNPASVMQENGPGRPLQIANAVVIAESLPRPEELLLLRGG